jgi:hypothetical protein
LAAPAPRLPASAASDKVIHVFSELRIVWGATLISVKCARFPAQIIRLGDFAHNLQQI